jgi:CHASE3 domain sensor protein
MADCPTDKDATHLRAGYVPLKEYVDARFDAVCRAVDKAESTLSARLATMNEFREQLKDQAGTFISRRETEALLEPLRTDLKGIREETKAFMSEHKGKASQTSFLWSAALAILGTILAIIGLFVK